MLTVRTLALTLGSLLCFAANSLLARAALRPRLVDAATFTSVRLASGAVALGLLLGLRRGRPRGGSWGSAVALFAYASAFSLAYLRIAAGVGALILFTAVQATMIGWAVVHGARPRPVQRAGILVALLGLAYLTLPGANAPDPLGAALMLAAGIAWGAYSLRGRAAADPLATTAENFLRSLPFAGAFSVVQAARSSAAAPGLLLAVASGAVASAGGYILWYAAVPALGATRAAAVQLAVPVLAAGAAIALLGEPLTGRLGVAAAAILTGIALTLRGGQ